MKIRLSHNLKTICILIILLVWSGKADAFQGESSDSLHIEFSSFELTMKQALKELQEQSGYGVVYGGKEINTAQQLTFSSKRLIMKDALNEIEKQASVVFVFNNSHIVVKSRNLKQSNGSPAMGTGKTVVLSGYVTTDQQEKLPGVNVYIKGNGTGTNEDGFYSLKLTEGTSTIIFSFIGYQTQEKTIELKGDKTLNIILNPNEEMLEEISITAQRKFFGNMNYGREISTIKSKEIEKISSSNASDILHARVAGVWATKTSGAPGDQQKIRVRGQTSFFSSAEPLYVIDGVPVPIVNLASLGIGDLNMHDIESLTVLKDASSTALYGYQGANGVVLIDTKQTSTNKINFSYSTGVQWFNNFYDLMNTNDFLESTFIAKEKIGSEIYKYFPPYSDTLSDHNWQDEIFKTGMVNEIQLSSGGKIKSLKYYLSGSLTKHEGIISGSAYKRGTFTARGSRLFGNKLAIDLSYRGSYQDNKNNQNTYGGNRIILEGINISPLLESIPDSMIRDPEPPYTLYKRINYSYGILNSNAVFNKMSGIPPLQKLFDDSRAQLTTHNHAVSIMGRYQINKVFSVNAIESALYRESRYDSDMRAVEQQVSSDLSFSTIPIVFVSDEEVRLINHQVNFTYNQIIGLHNINLVAAHRYYADNLWWEVDSLKNELPEHYSFRNSMAGYGMQGSVIRRLTSYIMHGSYNFRETYYLSAVANMSRVKEGIIDYYTLFPSLSFSWDISKESFFPKTKLINELNAYVNYGNSGNYPLSGLSNDIYAKNSFSNGVSETETRTYVDQFANHFLRHEHTTELDFGLKSSFFNNRMELNAALYKKIIGNQIIKRNIPYYYGSGEMYLNFGDIGVLGYEASVNVIPVKTKNFKWYLNSSYSSSKPVVTKLIDHEELHFYNEDVLFPEFIIKEGNLLGDIYGYKYMGPWLEEYASNPYYARSRNTAFFNNDTINKGLNESDRMVLGNSLPDFTWNLSSSFQYKNFSLDIVLYSVWGVDKFNATRASTIMTGLNREVLGFYQDSILAIGQKEFYESSLFIDDASFIRLKTLSLGYSPYKKIMGVKCDFTLSFENLLTFTRYRGYDPEATIYTDNNFSDNAIDKGSYPSPKSVFFKINLRL